MPAIASHVLGVLIAIFAFIGLAPGAGPGTLWVVGVLGILAFIAPWVLGYASQSSAFWPHIILDAVTIIIATIGIFARPSDPAA